jgi:MinD-like ATPase involved in chromosome partitioning or flagellar assembly
VLVAAAGAAWEAAALRHLDGGRQDVVLVKRCVDLQDLLATASTGQARVALLAQGLPGLDADSVSRLRRAGLGVVLVADPPAEGAATDARTRRLGVAHVVGSNDLGHLVEALVDAGAGTDGTPERVPDPPDLENQPGTRSPGGRLVAVWGPAGAPGRTTVSVGLAAELAHRSHPTVLVDADTYGGAVAQHLGVLDEVSGVLAAARAANAGELDPTRLAGMARQVGGGPRVLTGLPRADRWAEVREPAFTQVLEQARTLARFVVVDTGFSLEVDSAGQLGGSGPQRNAMTLTALEQADEVLLVGSADPVGLARLARGIVELLEQVPGCTVRVVVNRSRASLGWREAEIHTMIGGFVSARAVHFLPEDRAAADRALVAGRSLVEGGDSALRRAIAQVADAVLGEISVTRRPRRLRPRR